MFKFQTNAVINDNTFKIVGSDLVLDGIGEFNTNSILAISTMYGEEAVKCVTSLPVSAISGFNSCVLRFIIKLSDLRGYSSDYASHQQDPHRETTFEYFIKTDVSTEILSVLDKLKANLARLSEQVYLDHSSDEHGFIFTTDKLGLVIDVQLEVIVNDQRVQTVNSTQTTSPTLGKGTPYLLMNDYSLPTFENTKYGVYYNDIRPNALYNQLVLFVLTDRPELGGVSAVGQRLQSLNTHCLYINHEVLSDFYDLLSTNNLNYYTISTIDELNRLIRKFSNPVNIPAPTNLVIDDVNNTFDFDFIPGYPDLIGYEMSIEPTLSYIQVPAKPYDVGNRAIPKGQIKIRLGDTLDHPAGAVLTNTDEFTVVIKPAAPTAPVEDDTADTFDWTNNPSFTALSDYEYTNDGGTTASVVTAKPMDVGDEDFAPGDIGVRVAAANGNPASNWLFNTTAYTKI